MASHPHSWSQFLKHHLIWVLRASLVLLIPGTLTLLLFVAWAKSASSSWTGHRIISLPVSLSPDLQKSHSSWSLQLCSNVILLKSYFIRNVFPVHLLSQSSHLCEPPAIHSITLWISKGETDYAAGKKHLPKPVAYHIQGWVLAPRHIAVVTYKKYTKIIYMQICVSQIYLVFCPLFLAHSCPKPLRPPKYGEWERYLLFC